jgi:carbamoyl-phosphate synthase large subunit
LADRDKQAGLPAAEAFQRLGFDLVATSGTAAFLRDHGVSVATVVAKVGDPDTADAVDAVDLIASGQIDLVVNTPRGKGSRTDGYQIRTAATVHNVSCLTTVAAALAAATGMAERAGTKLSVRSLQEFHGR